MGGSTGERRRHPARQHLDSLPGSGALFERGTWRQGRRGRFVASIPFALDSLALGRMRLRARGFGGGGAALAWRNIRTGLCGFAIGGLGAVVQNRRRLCGLAGRRLRVGGTALADRRFRSGFGGLVVGALGAIARRRRPWCGLAGRRRSVGGASLADRRFRSGRFRSDLAGLAVGTSGAVARAQRLGAGCWTGRSDDRSTCVERRLARLGVEKVAGGQQPDHDRTGDAQKKRRQHIVTHIGGVFG